MERLSPRVLIKYAILSAFTAAALSMHMPVPELSEAQTANFLCEIFWNFSKSLEAVSFPAGILWGVLLFAKCKLRGHFRTEHSVIYTALNFLIACVWLFGEGFRVDDSIYLLHATKGQVLKSILYVTGITAGLNDLSILFLGIMRSPGRALRTSGNQVQAGKNSAARSTLWKKVVYLSDRHPFGACFFTLLILWLPHILIAYPAYFCYDSWSQAAQYFGLAQFKSHHPPVMTLLMGTVIRIGSLWNGNFGLFLFVLLQTCVIGAVEAHLFVLFHELRTPGRVKVLTLVLCAFVPYYTDYIGLFLKDNLYSYMVLLFHIELAWLLLREETFFRSLLHPFLWILSACGVILFRNNGKYVLYPILLFLGVLWLKRFPGVRERTNRTEEVPKKQPAAGRAVTVLVLLLLPIALSSAISAYTMRHYSITKGSIREAFSLPMQQTARYVKYYGDEIPEEEKAAIRTVLDYDKLAEAYDPAISDPVKRLFKFSPTLSDLTTYFKVWLRQFFRHPDVYFGAVLNQNYYLLYPFVPNDSIYSSVYARYPEEKKLLKQIGAHEIAALKPAKQAAAAYYRFCLRMPGLSILSHPSTYVILLLWMITDSMLHKRKRFLLLTLPSVFSLGIILLSPVIQDSPRYFFPVFYAAPLLLAAFIYEICKGEVPWTR